MNESMPSVLVTSIRTGRSASGFGFWLRHLPNLSPTSKASKVAIAIAINNPTRTIGDRDVTIVPASHVWGFSRFDERFKECASIHQAFVAISSRESQPAAINQPDLVSTRTLVQTDSDMSDCGKSHAETLCVFAGVKS